MLKNLVIARVGAASLHPRWLDAQAARNWDLRLCPFEPVPAAEPVIAGPKWSGLCRLLSTWDGWRAYDYIWLPDDDIDASQATINRLFEAAAAARLDLFDPALGALVRRALRHGRQPQVLGRRVGFVEIMMPGFSRPHWSGCCRRSPSPRPAGAGGSTRSGRSCSTTAKSGLNDRYQDELRREIVGDRLFFAGRLANYLYIDMDDCMRQIERKGAVRQRARHPLARRPTKFRFSPPPREQPVKRGRSRCDRER